MSGGLVSGEILFPVSQMLSLCPHMDEVVRECSEVSFKTDSIPEGFTLMT